MTHQATEIAELRIKLEEREKRAEEKHQQLHKSLDKLAESVNKISETLQQLHVINAKQADQGAKLERLELRQDAAEKKLDGFSRLDETYNHIKNLFIGFIFTVVVVTSFQIWGERNASDERTKLLKDILEQKGSDKKSMGEK